MADDAPLPGLRPLPPFPAAGLRRGDIEVGIWDPAGDAADWQRLARDLDQDRWGAPVFVPRSVNLVASRQRLEREVSSALAGQPASYAVRSRTSGALLGDVACRLDLPPLLIADLGYATLPEARGRGVARTALQLLAGWLLDPADGAGLARVQLDHAVENHASCRVALAAGFGREGLRRSFLPLCDERVPAGWSRADVCLHGRLPGDPIPAGEA